MGWNTGAVVPPGQKTEEKISEFLLFIFQFNNNFKYLVKCSCKLNLCQLHFKHYNFFIPKVVKKLNFEAALSAATSDLKISFRTLYIKTCMY